MGKKGWEENFEEMGSFRRISETGSEGYTMGEGEIAGVKLKKYMFWSKK